MKSAVDHEQAVVKMILLRKIRVELENNKFSSAKVYSELFKDVK